MSFLSIAFLAALPLTAAPILLHLFDRRRSVVIEWGAMQFLQEAATRKTNARRVQQWLLLLLRVAAVAALVLALAQPMLPGNWLGASGPEETILVLDNSMSTLRDSDGKPLFDSLLARAEAALDAVRPGDSVRLLSASPYPVWVTPTGVRIDVPARLELLERLRALRPTHGSSDLLASLHKAVQADFDEATLRRRRIVVMTDGQRGDWKTDNAEGWKRVHAVLAEARVPTSVEVVELGDANVKSGNIAVNSVRASRTVVGLNQSFTVTAVVQNHAGTPSAAGSVICSIGETKLPETQVPALEPGATHELVWRHAFNTAGVFRLTCRADQADVLPPDNAASVVVEAVDRIPVVFIEGAEGFAEIQQDAYLVQAALGRSQDSQANEWRAVFEPHTIAAQQLESVNLDQYRAVVISNLTRLSPLAVERLHEFVSSGGGLWLALGPRTEIGEFNQLLFNNGDGLSPVAIDQIVDESSDDSRKTTINPFLKYHPATRDLADAEQLDTADVKVTRRFRFRMPAAAHEVSVLLDLTNGDPLAVENLVGNGRVIVQSIPLRLQWSELASSQAFVVMVHAWLGYLTEPGATRHNLLPGEPIAISVADTKNTNAILTTPSGEDVTVTGEPAENGMAFRTSRTVLPGDYSLDLGLSGSGMPFYVARDAAESNLAGLSATDRALLAETVGVGQGAAAAIGLGGTSQRDPIWPALLVALIALIAGELVLSGVIAKQRFGMEEIPESVDDWGAESSLSPARFGNPLSPVPTPERRSPAMKSPDSETVQV